MARTATRRASSAPLARRAPAGVSKAKYAALQARLRSTGQRLRAASNEDMEVGASLVAAVGAAWYEKSGRSLPTVMGLDPHILYGAVGYAVTRNGKSKNARLGRAASIGLLTVGASRATTRGSLKVSGYEIGADVDDDDDDDDIDGDDID